MQDSSPDYVPQIDETPTMYLIRIESYPEYDPDLLHLDSGTIQFLKEEQELHRFAENYVRMRDLPNMTFDRDKARE